jgi:hypothetical protein
MPGISRVQNKIYIAVVENEDSILWSEADGLMVYLSHSLTPGQISFDLSMQGRGSGERIWFGFVLDNKPTFQ